MKPILEVKNLTMDFGGIRALNHMDLDIKNGEIAALIGPNGAGKTTFFNCITGIYTPTAGDMIVNPSETRTVRINGMKPHRIKRTGLARTFQNIRLFKDMTALENIMIGRHCRTRSGILGAFFKNKSSRNEEQLIIHDSFQLLKKINLQDKMDVLAKNLSYGDQRRLEIVRALAAEPLLLLLDEPAAGMNPQETKDLKELILQTRDEYRIAILLIEHDMKLVMSLSERIFVMDYGRKIAEGTPEEIRANKEVIKAYLGEDDHHDA